MIGRVVPSVVPRLISDVKTHSNQRRHSRTRNTDNHNAGGYPDQRDVSGISGAKRIGSSDLPVSRASMGSDPSMRSPRSAIVAGAGIAGLTAARDLKQAGRRLDVLETRPCLGGRLWAWSGKSLLADFA